MKPISVNIRKNTQAVSAPVSAAKDAYQLARTVDPGIGTLEEWLASLKGEQGDMPPIDADPNMAANSDTVVASQKAVKTRIAALDATLTAALASVGGSVAAETARAQTAESALAALVTAEEVRAIAAEEAEASTRVSEDGLLQTQINNITTLLESSDIDLDQLQEIVDFIKQNKEDLDTLTVNNIAGLEDALADLNAGITGNAGSASVLQTARQINGVAFDGSANITVTAAAGTLTGISLASGVTAAPGLLSAAGGTFGSAAFTSASLYATKTGGNTLSGTQNLTGDIVMSGSQTWGSTKKFYLLPDWAGYGELGTGSLLGSYGAGSGSFSFFPSINGGDVGAKVAMGYASNGGTNVYSAAEVANVTTGFSNLLLMKSGGNVLVGTATDNGVDRLQVNGSIAGTWGGSAIAATLGGTGLTSYALGDILYASAANTLAKLTGNTSATMAVLTQTGNGSVSAAPVWTSAADLSIGGNAATATALANARTINGVSFNGTANIGQDLQTTASPTFAGLNLAAGSRVTATTNSELNGIYAKNSSSGSSALTSVLLQSNASSGAADGFGFFLNSSGRTAEAGASGGGFYNDLGPVTYRSLTTHTFTTGGFPGTARMVLASTGLTINQALAVTGTTALGSGMSLTGSQATNVLDLSPTWNTTGNPTLLYGRVTNTASGSTANFIDLGTVAGGSLFKVDKNAAMTVGLANDYQVRVFGNFQVYASNSNDCQIGVRGGSANIALFSGYAPIMIGGLSIASNWTGANGVNLVNDATHILAQRNGVNPQTFRLYNYFSARGAGTTSLEALEIKTPSSGAFIIQSLKGSVGGSARNIELRHGATDTNGTITDGSLIATVTATALLLGGSASTTDGSIWFDGSNFKIRQGGASYSIPTSGGGGLTNFTESAKSSAPNATVPVVQFLATNAATNVDAALTPKGTGSLLAQIPDNTSAGGNKRGINAVDWQTSRASATKVASGDYSVISGGRGGVASANDSFLGGGNGNTVSGTGAAVAGGTTVTASGLCAFVGGGNNNSASQSYGVTSGGDGNANSGQYAFITGGRALTVSGTYAGSLGGNGNTATATYGLVRGNYASDRGIYGAFAQAPGNFDGSGFPGQAQTVRYPMYYRTTNGTQAQLTANWNSATTANTMVLPNNSGYAYEGKVVARSSAGDVKIWTFSGGIKKATTAGSTVLVGTQTNTSEGDAGASAWDLTIDADTTNGTLRFRITGAAATTIGWNGYCDTTEVIS